ncbi:ANTAR domain-containing protein [Symbioplanes lichenis]|uniref:ANTAR domain-containing protein n=1 Tax=Symbioplanes lichenis TaxID=1629072 RepID=UPI002739C538|nr:ANTAR domain-containing protein [Actinoplanes lichenis]
MCEPAGHEELARAFLRLNELLRTGDTRVTAMRRLVGLAVTAVPGCDWAAVTAWPEHGRPRSIAVSDEVALTADTIQYALGAGPCLSAAGGDDSVHVADLADEGRWAQFRVAVRRRTPIRGLLSLRLQSEPERFALNLYSGRPYAYDLHAVATAALFAAHARVLLLHAGSSDRVAQLDQALAGSRQIGAAVGILMSVHRLTADDAFALLRSTSQHLNRKLLLVADEVTRTGALPGPGR